MSLFAGKRNKGRNFRRRRDDDDDNEADGEASATVTWSKPTKRLPAKNKPVVQNSTSLLSFDDEEESGTEVFKIKKLNRQKKPPPAKPQANAQVKVANKPDSVPVYFEEETGVESRDSSDEEVTMAGNDAEESDEEDARAELARQIRMGTIPDAITIHAARKQREMARQLGGDYLPLDDTQCYAANNSRLVRDDENDKSGSDEERDKDIGFSKVSGITKQQQVLEALETVAESEESDEEMRQWEEEQINKGVKIIQATQQPVSNSLPTGDQSFGVGTGAYPYVEAQTQFPYQQYGDWQQQQQQLPSNTAASRLPEKLSPLTIASVKGRLQSRLDELKEMNSGHRQSLTRIKDMKVAAVDDIDSVQARSGDVNSEYQFFQEMKLYLEDLLSCLAEKAPLIDDLHKKVLEARQLRAERFAIRRQQDIQDELDECKAHPSKAVVPDESKKALLRRHRQVERQARRRRRKDARQKEGISPEQHNEGLSTDDEEKESDKQIFVQQIAQAAVEGDKLFDDVVDEFASISMIKSRLEKWKFQFPQSYQQAYLSLCLPKLFLPFVKLQLLTWNPLEAKMKDFEEMGWFEILMFYGFREGYDTMTSNDDDNAHLIPSLVERAVLPLVTSLVENVWEVMSSRQTKCLSQLVSRLMEDYPTVSTDSKNTEIMLNAILTRLHKAVDDAYVPLFSKLQLENSTKHSEFFNRQFWSCVKLLGNITIWRDTLSSESLKQLAVDRLLNRHLLLSLKSSPPDISLVDKAEKIITLLPVDWYQCDHNLFTGLSRYLVSLSELLGYSTVNEDNMSTRDAVTQIAELLEIIGASEHSELVIREHTLKVNR